MRYLLLTAALLLGGGWSATAAETTYRLPSETAFILNLDLQAVQKSAVGGPILDAAIQKAIRKGVGKGTPNREELLSQVKQIIGFDPLKEIKSITVSATDYAAPEHSLVAVVQLGKTSGNLEGLLLGLPKYQVTDYEGQQIHSASPDPEEGQTLYVAFVTDESGDRRILLSAQRQAVTNLVDQAAGKTAGSEATTEFTIAQAADRLLSLKVLRLPEEAIEEGPPANVARLMKDAVVHIDEADGKVAINTSLTATDEKQAEQLRQMAQGGVAMLQVAKSANPEDQNLQKLTSLVEDASTSREGSTVNVSIQVPAAEITALIEEKLKNK